MPAAITHNIFGKDVYNRLFDRIGQTKDEFDAFLVGCQGPDILFFSKLSPTLHQMWNLGTLMHKCDASELMMCFSEAADLLPSAMAPIGRAYTEGLICHYLLDSEMHPFVYAQQFEICDAGIEDLDESSGHDVHAFIESELDILVLSTKEEKTISEFNPAEKTLCISRYAAHIISLMYKKVAQEVFGINIPEDAAQKCISNYRIALETLYSPTGIKRMVLGMGERLFRKHSIMQAMSHENKLLFESDFDNKEHREWKNPWTLDKSNKGFWDIYEFALNKALDVLPLPNNADKTYFEHIAPDSDFDGRPVKAKILSVE